MKKLNASFIEPLSGQAKQLVVFLHGYGANGADLLSIAEEWREELPDAVFISPDAPDVCEGFGGGFQWFSIRAIDRNTIEREKQVESVAPVLDAFLDEQLAHWGLEEKSLAVAGFSQGAMMAMYAMPRRKKPCAGVIAYSGMLIDAEGLKAGDIVKMPVLAVHGDRDDIVTPLSLAHVEKGFSAAGFDIETLMRPGLTHGIDHLGIMRGLEFLKEGFGLTQKSTSAFLK